MYQIENQRVGRSDFRQIYLALFMLGFIPEHLDKMRLDSHKNEVEQSNVVNITKFYLDFQNIHELE